jgi:hypothetical protein
MSNTIQIKRSSTASSVPTAGQLAQGELAVNLVDKKLYTKDNTNAVVELTAAIASTAEAQAGTNNTNVITPLRMREGFNASGSAPVYACRAWVNFNGTTSPGTIRASGNVSSVTRNGTGDYTVNFTTAMPDANYIPLCGADFTGGQNIGATVLTTTSVKVFTRSGPTTFVDYNRVDVAIIR